MNPSLKLGLLLLLMMGSVVRPGSAWAYKGPPPSQPAQREEVTPDIVRYTLAPGTALQVLLQTPLDTSINQWGDPVEAIMDYNLYVGEDLIFHKSTRFIGSITQLDPPVEGGNAILEIHFKEFQSENGEKIPIEAHVRTERPDHKWGGEVTAGTKPEISAQRIYNLGTYNRVVMTGPRAMGAPVIIPPGEHLILILDTPLMLLKPKEEL